MVGAPRPVNTTIDSPHAKLGIVASGKSYLDVLEAMEERQVSVDGDSRPLPSPFFVIATQNPSDQLGTHPLPESQLDRFAMRLSLGYPEPAAERALLSGQDRREALALLSPVMSPAEWQHCQAQLEGVHVADSLLDYLLRLINEIGRAHV